MDLTEQSFKLIFNKHYAELFVYAKHIVGEDYADDVVEDVFVNLWNRRESIIIGEKIRSFLYKSTFTHCVNMLKRQKTSAHYVDLVTDINTLRVIMAESEHTDKPLENTELGLLITSAIDHLPEKTRQIFQLSYLQDKRNKDIAALLGLSEKTIEGHITRALKQLRQELGHVAPSIVLAALSHFY